MKKPRSRWRPGLPTKGVIAGYDHHNQLVQPCTSQQINIGAMSLRREGMEEAPMVTGGTPCCGASSRSVWGTIDGGTINSENRVCCDANVAASGHLPRCRRDHLSHLTRWGAQASRAHFCLLARCAWASASMGCSTGHDLCTVTRGASALGAAYRCAF